VVTEAYRQGCWLLLDNISEAEAAVLERLNPVLEQPPCWVVTEKGDVTPMEKAAGWQLLATMTPPSRHGSSELGIQVWLEDFCTGGGTRGDLGFS
jgi:midasin (ATPase involved in ribosome maturation)